MMKTVTTIPQEIAALTLPDASGVIVMAGAAMELYGLRPADDIDLLVSRENWDYLQAKSGWQLVQTSQTEAHLRSLDDRFDVWVDWLDVEGSDQRLTFEDMKQHAQRRENGFFVATLPYLQQFKAHLGRAKDRADLALIRQHTER